jgi:N-acetylneuraminic acid mutarotase
MNYKRRILQIIGFSLVVLLLLAACATPSEEPLNPTPESLHPSPRAYTSMAYDEESDRVILFGGQSGNYTLDDSYNGETWVYDVTANKWTEMKPASGPTRRGCAELAYDAESDRVILFGGCFGADYIAWGMGDTWAYDYNTNTWKEMAKGPAKHLGARLAYDAESDRVILFGGYDAAKDYFNDTWSYDFNSDTWTEMKPSTSPPIRNYNAMAYDAAADRVLIWGCYYVYPDDVNMWSYDFNTNTWQEIKPGEGAHPLSRDYTVMAYDVKSDQTILYGGTPLGDETWAYAYKTNTWTKLEPGTVPGRLSRHAIVYSTAADLVILFGGVIGSYTDNYSGDTWTYNFNTNTWANMTLQP